MKVAVVLLAALPLSGCLASQPASPVQLQGFAATCQAYGFRPRTNEFAGCMAQLDQNRIAANEDRRSRIRGALAGYGSQLQNNAAYQRPVTCTSTPSGTFVGRPTQVNTTCY